MAAGGGERAEDPLVAGSERDAGGEERDLAASRRDAVGDLRDLAGTARDLDSDARDDSGERRDLAAEERDRAAEARDRVLLATRPSADDHLIEVARSHARSDRSHAARDRHAGARDRSISEQDRATSLADRRAGEAERTGSALDRVDGGVDRGAAADDREWAALDGLTGVRNRGSGLTELAREMARAERTSQPLTLVYVDVDHLKSINDARGHAAGDGALVGIVEAIRRVLRSYDLVVRLGGDEFVCVLAGIDEVAARERFTALAAALAADDELPSATFGVAEMVAQEPPADLIARADADLYAQRERDRNEIARS